ncbi:MAG: hypothetical protein U5N26_02655 [Candidatus Marinimicrobia bacterium]|nr:hypothetical protein [Candidatus Neomarinimicrobiota bacterium]
MKQSYDLEPFDALVIAGPVHLILDQNGGSRAEVESYESMMELFRVPVRTEGTLYLLYVVDRTAGNAAAVEA